MPDLVLGPGHPFNLVTTVVDPRNGLGRAQLDLHTPSTQLRIRFHDRDSLLRLQWAIFLLRWDLDEPDPDRPVRSRVLADHDPVDHLVNVPLSPPGPELEEPC